MPDDARQDDRHFNHPGDGAPKIAEQLQKRIGLLFLNFVRPILLQSRRRFRLRQAIRRRTQFFLDLREMQGLQIVLRIRLRIQLWIREPWGDLLQLS